MILFLFFAQKSCKNSDNDEKMQRRCDDGCMFKTVVSSDTCFFLVFERYLLLFSSSTGRLYWTEHHTVKVFKRKMMNPKMLTIMVIPFKVRLLSQMSGMMEATRRSVYISPQCMLTTIPFPFYNLTFSYFKETCSLSCFDMPGCLEAVLEKKTPHPTAPTGV